MNEPNESRKAVILNGILDWLSMHDEQLTDDIISYLKTYQGLTEEECRALFEYKYL